MNTYGTMAGTFGLVVRRAMVRQLELGTLRKNAVSQEGVSRIIIGIIKVITIIISCWERVNATITSASRRGSSPILPCCDAGYHRPRACANQRHGRSADGCRRSPMNRCVDHRTLRLPGYPRFRRRRVGHTPETSCASQSRWKVARHPHQLNATTMTARKPVAHPRERSNCVSCSSVGVLDRASAFSWASNEYRVRTTRWPKNVSGERTYSA